MRRLISGLAGVALLWAAGLVIFVAGLPKPPASPPVAADGVVVFTGGGGARITAAMSIFANGAGQRMLISGVHPDTSLQRLSELWPGDPDKFACCIDLGREALTTQGNAGELSAWAHNNQYKTIILVTSEYHMPRAVALTRARMPKAIITPYAVASGYLDGKGRPTSFDAGLRLAGEYTKFLFARLQTLFSFIGR